MEMGQNISGWGIGSEATKARTSPGRSVQGAAGRPAGLGPRLRGQREGCCRGAGAQPAGLPCRPGQGAGV